jgi:hypothetical protein
MRHAICGVTARKSACCLQQMANRGRHSDCGPACCNGTRARAAYALRRCVAQVAHPREASASVAKRAHGAGSARLRMLLHERTVVVKTPAWLRPKTANGAVAARGGHEAESATRASRMRNLAQRLHRVGAPCFPAAAARSQVPSLSSCKRACPPRPRASRSRRVHSCRAARQQLCLRHRSAPPRTPRHSRLPPAPAMRLPSGAAGSACAGCGGIACSSSRPMATKDR